MDSCHIFNFLFNTRKTANDLRKCFANAPTAAAAERNRARPARQPGSPPASPLRQIHSKLVNFAASSAATVTKLAAASSQPQQAHNLDAQRASCTARQQTSGTYKATLIELPLADDERDLDDGGDSISHYICAPADERQEAAASNSSASFACGQLAASETPISEKGAEEAGRRRAAVTLVENPGAELGDSPPDGCWLAAAGEARQQQQQQQQDKLIISKRVRRLVQSFESFDANDGQPAAPERPGGGGGGPLRLKWPPAEVEPEAGAQEQAAVDAAELARKRPTTIVKPLPPKTPPKSNRAKCLNLQLTLNKPLAIERLFQDDAFLARHFFAHLRPLDRCSAAQVCRKWRNILYANPAYWSELVGVIDCTQLRREHLIECIVNTLQSAKLKHQLGAGGAAATGQHAHQQHQQQARWPAAAAASALGDESAWLETLDQDEIWRIQELCNRYARGSLAAAGQHRTACANASSTNAFNGAFNGDHQQQQLASSKSQSSIPSPISSTMSSVSISSLLSPLSESSRVDSVREKLYTALDERGFDALCLFGATDDDIEELVCKTRPQGAQRRVRVGRLNNCALSDKGLRLFLAHFNQIEELELTGCNELTNGLELAPLQQLKRLTITDCINIADGLAQRLADVFNQLEELCVQAYHLTDAFLEFLSLNNDTSRLRRLELFQCKEITNSSMLTIAKHFQAVQALSVSGSSRITDDGVELLTEHAKQLRSLDLSWCAKVTDVSLECLACDLAATLSELILDRNVHITDCGLGYLATMGRLEALSIRWCPRVTDLGLEALLTMRNLRRLSLAGLQQLTARGLLALAAERPAGCAPLDELELTNCPAVNGDLLHFLRTKLPKCNIIY